ncbi:N-acetyl sugar amidotransferase [Candidatus Pelagibacter communis]|uniref:N-acetyl sugar amidotransferase n=1 Tax=Pelagibacter ubique TaxID=198252 RepID=UPI00094C4C88|nr:N-acetyl sugar amidotransferase [Candidatus Pelagibacter ubique]
MKYCKECLYPSVSVLLNIHDDGICSGCRSHKSFLKSPDEFWKKREKKFQELLNEYKNESYYDCIVPVSGGKDSYYQTHVICKKYNLKPLLITYDGNNWLPEGEYNRNQLKNKFDIDHIMWSPSVDVLKKLNRLAFRKIGDMNWHDHCGIVTVPIIMAVKFKIPLIIWGETEWDIAGIYGPEDVVEFSNRSRHENSLRGYEWYDFIKNNEEKLTEKDFAWAKYPSDEEILSVGVRGIYIGNFFKWDGKRNAELMKEKYDWRASKKPFERTYRNFSNLDNRYSNGVSDLLKFVKFGYGRCTDHASKDIRNKHINRDKGIELVKKHDHVVSADLEHWLEYVNMSKQSFWETADKFRDPRVWTIKNKQWYKDNIWGEESAYGDVYLNDEQINEFNEKKKKLHNRKI